MFYKLKKQFILFLLQSWMYSFMMKHVIWRVRFTIDYNNFPGHKYKDLYNTLQPGDIILATDSKKLTCKLIPGFLDHAALCIGKDPSSGVFEVAEMVHSGYREVMFYDLCSESTRVIIMRCRKWNPEYIPKIIEMCRSFNGKEYDIEFISGIKVLYCSSMVYHSDFMHLMNVDLSDLAGIGRKYISPMGLFLSYDNYCVADSEHEFTGIDGNMIEEKLRGTYAR